MLSAETPTAEWTERLGTAPDIYSAEINHWLLKAALWILRDQPGNRRPLHPHHGLSDAHVAARGRTSRRHLAGLDALFGELSAAAPDAAILLTADHGMHHKTRCWDLMKACAARGVTSAPPSPPSRTNTSSITAASAAPPGCT